MSALLIQNGLRLSWILATAALLLCFQVDAVAQTWNRSLTKFGQSQTGTGSSETSRYLQQQGSTLAHTLCNIMHLYIGTNIVIVMGREDAVTINDRILAQIPGVHDIALSLDEALDCDIKHYPVCVCVFV